MNRILIVGCPRSGTTLLQSMICSAPMVCGYTESHIFRINEKDKKQRLSDFFDENDIPPSISSGFVLKDGKVDAEKFFSILDEDSRRKGCDSWVEKTPDHLFALNEIINSTDTNLSIIHIVRKPGETIESMYQAAKQWGKPRSKFVHGLKWLKSIFTHMRYMNVNSHHFIFFEDISNPEDMDESLNMLLSKIGVASKFDESRRKNVAATLISRGESWKNNNMKNVKKYSQLGNLPLLLSFYYALLNVFYLFIKSKVRKG
ncbi:sulfotransferase family protein [Thiomicrorhabdus heinhorstiae]|uniref:Sulfotransferase n=1 Tax=Thiomicrorhabdus heinhorstiae TaxID=2748010 RepID=A0ABS0BVS8_9GAMM|nr:sulfotransferase [Thiomicrorhabdus heinhorstiae]MBF6057933.1 sulfotransferase [Thiomicrorhabdus heinhorstiae]